jgi:hypothetical protein
MFLTGFISKYHIDLLVLEVFSNQRVEDKINFLKACRDEACAYLIFGESQAYLYNVCSEYQIALSMLTASCFSCLHFSMEVSFILIDKTKYNNIIY